MTDQRNKHKFLVSAINAGWVRNQAEQRSYLRPLHRAPISDSSFPLKSPQLWRKSSCKEGRTRWSIAVSSSRQQSIFRLVRCGFGGNKGIKRSIDGATSWNNSIEQWNKTKAAYNLRLSGKHIIRKAGNWIKNQDMCKQASTFLWLYSLLCSKKIGQKETNPCQIRQCGLCRKQLNKIIHVDA